MKRARQFVYLGWQDRGNFGDDLLVDSWRAALDSSLDIIAPLYWQDLVKAGPSLIRSRFYCFGSERVLILGGGTALGFTSWARHILQAKVLFGIKYVFSAGAGSAESADQYAVGLQPQNWQSWRSIRGLTLAGVRGPLTQVEVSSNWRPTGVVGDPALMYSRLNPLTKPSNPARTLGVCLGSHTSTRFEINAVADAIEISASALGLKPVVFQLSDADAAVSTELSVKLGGARIEKYAGNVKTMMERIAETSTFVSERLHGAVAAVSLGIPCTPLSYASKCDDFWLSVTDERAPVTPTSSAREISQAIAASNSFESLARIADRVTILQHKLLDISASLSAWERGEESWDTLNRRLVSP